MKSMLTVSVDTDVLIEARKKSINISAVCNDALKFYVSTEKEDLEKKEKELKNEMNKILLRKKKEESQNNSKKKQEENLNEFIKNTRPDIVYNENALNIWAGQTGKTTEELKKIKGGKNGY